MRSVNYFNAWDIGRCYIAKARSKFLHIDGRYLRILLVLPFEDNIIYMWHFIKFYCYTEWLLSRENQIRWGYTPLLFSERDLDSFPRHSESLDLEAHEVYCGIGNQFSRLQFTYFMMSFMNTVDDHIFPHIYCYLQNLQCIIISPLLYWKNQIFQFQYYNCYRRLISSCFVRYPFTVDGWKLPQEAEIFW